jgi:hypothetical protein
VFHHNRIIAAIKVERQKYILVIVFSIICKSDYFLYFFIFSEGGLLKSKRVLPPWF